MSNLFPTSGQAGVQEMPTEQSGGNLFGENNSTQLAAQQAMIQRMQALQQAQLTPEQNGAFMASQAGNMLGKGLGNLINPPQPDPRQVKLAQIKQAVDNEAQSSGITNPEDYLRLAASHLIQAGEYQAALNATSQADSILKGTTGNKLTAAQTANQAAEAAQRNQKTIQDLQTQPFAVEIERQKALGADPQSIERLASAAKLAADTGQVKPLADARIALETAQALHAKTLSEKEAKQTDYELMGKLFDEKGGGTITPAREALLNAMIDIKSKPQTIVNSVIGGAKTADTFLTPKVPAAKSPVVVPALKLPSIKTPSAIKPTGIATDGRPFYKWKNGKNYFQPEP